MKAREKKEKPEKILTFSAVHFSIHGWQKQHTLSSPWLPDLLSGQCLMSFMLVAWSSKNRPIEGNRASAGHQPKGLMASRAGWLPPSILCVCDKNDRWKWSEKWRFCVFGYWNTHFIKMALILPGSRNFFSFFAFSELLLFSTLINTFIFLKKVIQL